MDGGDERAVPAEHEEQLGLVGQGLAGVVGDFREDDLGAGLEPAADARKRLGDRVLVRRPDNCDACHVLPTSGWQIIR